MKKQILLIALLVAGFGINSQAQLNVNINIGSQPVWGPVGYDYVEYYYMPDIDAYYDVPRQQYVYYDNNAWVTRRALPPRYGNYNMYDGYKVVINEPRPWMSHDRYRTQYVQYKGRRGQQVIRDSRDVRYYANPRHPQHGKWKASNPGRANGHYKGNNVNRRNDYRNDGPGNREGQRGGMGSRGDDKQDRGNDNRGGDRDKHEGNGNGRGNGNGNGKGGGKGR
ncbi:MAG: hypothetical protein V4649_09510 [Bacteroidota bacterium]